MFSCEWGGLSDFFLFYSCGLIVLLVIFFWVVENVIGVVFCCWKGELIFLLIIFGGELGLDVGYFMILL